MPYLDKRTCVSNFRLCHIPYLTTVSLHYSLCKYIRSNFSVHILSYMHDIAIPTKDIFNRFQAILAEPTSNLFTRTVGAYTLEFN